jgi:trehalose-phosphatase
MQSHLVAWRQSDQARQLAALLGNARRSVLMLDYDGTLAPFEEERLRAVPYPGVAERLAHLARLPHVRLALVSGRPAGELRRMLAPEDGDFGRGFEIWGSHGWERITADGAYHLEPLGKEQRLALQGLRQRLEAHGLSRAIECKPASVAIHWRGADAARAGAIRALALSLYAGLAPVEGLELLPFNGGLELRSTVRTKGTVVDLILAGESPGIPAAYLGDDLTDEDAFQALGDRGFSILVGQGPRPSAAQFWLRPPEELVDFLDAWAGGRPAQDSGSQWSGAAVDLP